MAKTKNTQAKVPIQLEPGTSAYEIQKEVRELLSLTSIQEWEKELAVRGSRHTKYYHYTTLGVLKEIMASGHWRLNRLDAGNDPFEEKVHGTSFTTSSLSSMGMWYWYSKMREKNDIGVRIGIPKKTFRKIFPDKALLYRKDGNAFEPLDKADAGQAVLKTTDVAYWHFGKEEDGSNDMLFYKTYAFTFKALGLYDGLRKKTSASFKRPKENELPPSFKRAVWRTEAETRVYCDFGDEHDKVPRDVYVEIPQDAFGKMDFWLDPRFSFDSCMNRFDNAGKAMELLMFFGNKLLREKCIKMKQFSFSDSPEVFLEDK